MGTNAVKKAERARPELGAYRRAHVDPWKKVQTEHPLGVEGHRSESLAWIGASVSGEPEVERTPEAV